MYIMGNLTRRCMMKTDIWIQQVFSNKSNIFLTLAWIFAVAGCGGGSSGGNDNSNTNTNTNTNIIQSIPRKSITINGPTRVISVDALPPHRLPHLPKKHGNSKWDCTFCVPKPTPNSTLPGAMHCTSWGCNHNWHWLWIQPMDDCPCTRLVGEAQTINHQSSKSNNKKDKPLQGRVLHRLL